MLKIKANILTNFIRKTTASGQIEDCSLRFKEDGLHMIHKDTAGVILIAGVLSKTDFAEYEELEINVKNTSVLIATLNSFKDNIINIVKQDNMARFLDEDGGLDLALAEKVQCVKEGVPSLEYDNKTLVKKSTIDTITNRNSIVKSEDVIVKIENKELVFEIGKESDKAHSKSIASYEGTKKVVFDWEYFKIITANLDPVFDISLHEEVPSCFEEKTDKYTIKYFLTAMTGEGGK